MKSKQACRQDCQWQDRSHAGTTEKNAAAGVLFHISISLILVCFIFVMTIGSMFAEPEGFRFAAVAGGGSILAEAKSGHERTRPERAETFPFTMHCQISFEKHLGCHSIQHHANIAARILIRAWQHGQQSGRAVAVEAVVELRIPPEFRRPFKNRNNRVAHSPAIHIQAIDVERFSVVIRAQSVEIPGVPPSMASS